jgi:hypothetical protein
MDKGTEHKSAKRPLVLAVCSKFCRYSSYKNLRIDILSSSASLCRWRKQNIRPWNFGAGLPCEMFFRNVTPALYLVGSQQDTSMSVWLLPYKQWPCNYKLHCIFHLVTKATFFRLLHREPLQHRLKIELAATGRPSRRSLTFIPGRGITQTFIMALHKKMAG